MITLDDLPRDIKVDKLSKEKFESLSKRFDIDEKSIFMLAMKAGFFYNTRKKLGKARSLAQWLPLSEEDIKAMVVIAYATFEDIDKIFQGKEIAKVCEEFANGGIDYLYKLFTDSLKEDSRVIEDILDELAQEII